MKKLFISFNSLLNIIACLFVFSGPVYAQQHTGVMIASTGSITKHPTFDDAVVYRIQVKIKTATLPGAASDNPIYILLNHSDAKYFLVKAIDNYQGGHDDMYDVLDLNIKTIKDIQFIQLGLRGNDGWCIEKFELYLNNSITPSFRKIYAQRTGCIDNSSSLVIATGLNSAPIVFGVTLAKIAV